MNLKKQYENLIIDMVVSFAAKQHLVYLGHNSESETYRFKNTKFKFNFSIQDIIRDVINDVSFGVILEWYVNYDDEQRQVIDYKTFLKTRI